MRQLILLCCAVALALPVGAVQEGETASRPTRKGDALTVTGCLHGAALEATEVSAPDASALVAAGLTFRLTGDRKLLRELRQEHDRKVVEVRGVLKSELPHAAGQGHNVGGMRITIGAASPGGRLESEPRRVLPVLEVKSFHGSRQTSCAR